MAKEYFGVKQDQKSGKWNYSIKKHGNKRASWLKHRLGTVKEAAIVRELHILRDGLDVTENGNQRNFSDKDLIG